MTGQDDPPSGFVSPGTPDDSRLRHVLHRVLLHRARRAPLRRRATIDQPHPLIAARVASMLHGLLGAEAAPVLAELPHRVVIVTPDNFGAETAAVSLEDAWTLANIVLDDLGAPPLADDVPALDGLIAQGRAWIPEGALGAPTTSIDVVVHEVAHLLHDLRRAEVGLNPPQQMVIEVCPAQRETFAYACEMWACIERATAPGAARRELAALCCAEHVPADHRVDVPCLRRTLLSASSTSESGWSSIRRLGLVPS
ncbi:MAG: hypothetical protein AB8H79_16115 [Myxococcota bacterium]